MFLFELWKYAIPILFLKSEGNASKNLLAEFIGEESFFEPEESIKWAADSGNSSAISRSS